jgi:redox-sensitive bicupin YhaK (pirin superfamily)
MALSASITRSPAQSPVRQIARRTRGHSEGSITRLMSPSDFGQLLKPFVFLDLFDNKGIPSKGFGLHPHSGIATLTYLAEGSVAYEDTNGATGVLPAGGVEWMQAGGGVWHGGGAGKPGRTRGFQLWIALPPELELGPSVSLYQSPEHIQQEGPARVLLGRYGSATSAIAAPSPINYLAVHLRQGKRWRYQPPQGHTVFWIAVSSGAVAVPDTLRQATWRPSSRRTKPSRSRLNPTRSLSSVRPFRTIDLVLGYYSVHTSADALRGRGWDLGDQSAPGSKGPARRT